MFQGKWCVYSTEVKLLAQGHPEKSSKGNRLGRWLTGAWLDYKYGNSVKIHDICYYVTIEQVFQSLGRKYAQEAKQVFLKIVITTLGRGHWPFLWKVPWALSGPDSWPFGKRPEQRSKTGRAGPHWFALISSSELKSFALWEEWPQRPWHCTFASSSVHLSTKSPPHPPWPNLLPAAPRHPPWSLIGPG